MGRETARGNEAKSKMNHPSDMPMLRWMDFPSDFVLRPHESLHGAIQFAASAAIGQIVWRFRTHGSALLRLFIRMPHTAYIESYLKSEIIRVHYFYA